jgi:hypothetical protein
VILVNGCEKKLASSSLEDGGISNGRKYGSENKN